MNNGSGWNSVDSKSNFGYKPAKFAPYILLVVATGSSYAADRINEWQPYVTTRVPLQIDETRDVSSANSEALVGSLSLSEKVSFIKKTFNYGVSDLAKLLGISRQAIYKWNTDQVTPEAIVSVKVDNLAKVAIFLSDADVKRAGELIKLKYFGDQPLLEKAILGNVSDSYLEEVVSYIKQMQTHNNQITKLTESTQESEWLSSASLPHRGAN